MRHQPLAVLVSPLLPEPPVTGGQKRTLRLLETMQRAGLRPHLLTTDPGSPGAAAALHERGWGLDVVSERPPTVIDRLEQHARRRPSPFLHALARRLDDVAGGAALVQLEHTQSGYYATPHGVPLLLSLHNLDSAAARSAARARTLGSVAWLRERNRAAAMRHVERRALPRADRVLCVSADDAAGVRAAGGRPLLAPNGVDDEFFDVPPGLGERALFFGDFGYAANRHGLERFLAAGWSETRRRLGAARLDVAGAGIDASLRARLSAIPGVAVLGLVPDLLATLAAAGAVLIPIGAGGGTRLKALESLAAARPIASTPLGV
jgi:glycosyltransferase involved in cell wall biosynthesis